MTPPKVGFLMSNKVFGAQNSFFVPLETQKLIFSKNPNSVICPNMWGGQGSGPKHPDGVRRLGVIHYTPFKLLPPVNHKEDFLYFSRQS